MDIIVDGQHPIKTILRNLVSSNFKQKILVLQILVCQLVFCLQDNQGFQGFLMFSGGRERMHWEQMG